MPQPITIPKNYSVMIVEDSEADRYVLRRLLRRSGIGDTVYEVGDGVEALEFFESPSAEALASPGGFPPFLLFVDVNMPRMGGFEFLEAFEKKYAARADKPVFIVMVSSSRRPDDIARAQSFDFVRGYIEKFPSNADELHERVMKALQQD